MAPPQSSSLKRGRGEEVDEDKIEAKKEKKSSQSKADKALVEDKT